MEVAENIYQVCLCRKSVIDVLLKYISPHDCTQSVNSLFLYGNTGTGKTFLLNTILETLEVPHSFVNCIENYTSKHVYHKILKDAGYFLTKQCTSMVDFCRLLKQCDLDSSRTFYIVLDKAERLRSMESHLLPAFLRLGEICQLNICVVFVTELVLEKFFVTTGFHQPIPIHFPDYTKEDVISIMTLDWVGIEYSEEFYARYCKTVVDVFFMACRDLNELRHLALINFSTYCEPLKTGEVTKHTDVRSLWLKIVPHLRKALKTVYLREVSSGQWEQMETTSGTDETVVEKVKAQVELPYYSKYLLLAAYFASYNPANTDRRFFTKKSVGRMSKRAKASAKAAKNTDKKFLGPKQFQIDRLMAIFYSIVQGGASSSANILSQLSSLVTLNLLAKTSADDQIDTPKYKCLVSFDFAVSVAKQVDMDIAEYLYDCT